MPRRTIEAILAAHKMDPARRELYVEGPQDEDFLVWLAGGDIDPNAMIHPITLVEVPNVTHGGNRERVLVLARSVIGHGASIRCLVDADGVHLRDAGEIPANTWVTDARDLEWYVLREDCVAKALALGIRRRDVSARALLAVALAIALDVAALRSASSILGLDLPISRVELHNFLRVDRAARISFDLRRLVRSLLQASDISLRRLDEVMEILVRERERLGQVDLKFVVRGKDAVPVIAEAFTELCSLHRKDGHRLLWTGFERPWAAEYPILSELLDYLAGRRAFVT